MKTTLKIYQRAKRKRREAERARDRNLARRAAVVERQAHFDAHMKEHHQHQSDWFEREACELATQVLTLSTLLGQYDTAQAILDENKAVVAEAKILNQVMAEQELRALGDPKKWMN